MMNKIFDSEKLHSNCLELFLKKDDRDSLLFLDLAKIVIDDKAEEVYKKYTTDEFPAIPSFKLGTEISQKFLERALKIWKNEADEQEFKRFETSMGMLTRDLVGGVKQRLNHQICKTICENSHISSIEHVRDGSERLKSLLNSKVYDTLIIRGSLKTLAIPDINILSYKKSFWTKSGNGTPIKNYVLPENIGILYNSREKDLVEVLCTSTKESIVDLLVNEKSDKTKDVLYSYFEASVTLNPPSIEAYSVLRGFPHITKPECFKVITLFDK